MKCVNKVTVLGYVGNQPEMRYMPDGRAVCNFTVATSERWKDRNGDQKEATEWHRLVMYEPLSAAVGEMIEKGAPVYVEGNLKTRKWQDKNGVERYTTEIVVREISLLGGGRSSDGGSRPERQTRQPRQERQQPQQPQAKDYDDDIPF